MSLHSPGGNEQAEPAEDGVARLPRTLRPGRRNALSAALVLCASAAGLLLLFRGGSERVLTETPPFSDLGNRIKGAPGVATTVHITGAEGRAQRSANAGAATRLAPGERLRAGYALAAAHHLMLVSLDDAGVITPLFDEAGESSLVTPTPAMTYLPGSIELVGAGHERLYLFVSQSPFAGATIKSALREAYAQAGRSIVPMASPPLPRELAVHSWLFSKP